MSSPSPAPPPLPAGESWQDYRLYVVQMLNWMHIQNEQQNERLAELKVSLAILSTRMLLVCAGLAAVVTAVIEFASRLLPR